MSVSSADRRLTAGLAGRIPVVKSAAPLAWGLPGPDAVWIASPGDDSNRAAAFVYDARAALVQGRAPARRVGLFLTPEAIERLTADGWRIFDAAVRWTVSPSSLSEPADSTDSVPASSEEESSDGTAPAPTALPSAPPGSVALVVSSGAAGASDDVLKSRLQGLGYALVVKSSGAVKADDASGKRVVVITGTADHQALGEKLKGVTAPVLTLRVPSFPKMALTAEAPGSFGNTSLTQVSIALAGDPLAAGLSGSVAVVNPATLVGWGMPAPQAVTVATVPGEPTKATIFRYSKGATLADGTIAPGARAGMFLNEAAAVRLTANGGALLDACIQWLAGLLNARPQVSAGADHPALVNAPAVLDGSVLDDGVPGPLGVEWSVVACGPATIADPHAVDTTVTVSQAGPCDLRLTASDGQESASDIVRLNVTATNNPPTVNAGPNQTVSMPAKATLAGSAGDDGVPLPLTVEWSLVQGPGAGGVVFSAPSALVTEAAFTSPGSYRLRLTASDGQLSSFDEVEVSVGASGLLVVGEAALSPADAVIDSAMRAAGLSVSVVRASEASNDSAQGKAVVVVSSSCPPAELDSKFAFVLTPVVSLQGLSWNALLIANNNRLTTEARDDLMIPASPPHPISGGASGLQQVTSADQHFVQGSVAAGGVLVAKMPTTNDGVVFAYEKGSAILGTFARERRVGFGFPSEALEGSTSLARELLKRAIAWAAHMNRPPTVHAGPDQVTLHPGPVTVSGLVVDDGMSLPLTLRWSQLSGPAAAVFGDASQLTTTVMLAAPGTYTLKLSASDGQLAAADTIEIRVDPPPLVDAGADQTVTLPALAQLDGTVSDEASQALTMSWSRVSGPAPVNFGSGSSVDTPAQFTVPGVYVLRLTVSDGLSTRSDDTTVTVRAAAGGARVLLVVGAGAHPGDDALRARLELLGWTVTVSTDAQVEIPDAAEQDLVFLSGTVDASRLGSRFRALSVPAVVAQPALFPMMGFTEPGGSGTAPGQTRLRILDAGHPLAAGLSGEVTVTTSSQALGWGATTNGARVAEAAILGRAAVFGYEPGTAALSGHVPARRVGLFLAGESAAALSQAGWQLVEAAVDWCRSWAARPVLVPRSGAYPAPLTVRLSSASGGIVRYTTDGSEPQATSPAYQSPLVLTASTTLKAASFRGTSRSETVVEVYTITQGALARPTFTPPPGPDDPPLSVTLSASAGAQIRYTLDGSEPSADSALYAGPLALSNVTVVRARAFREGWTPSAVASAEYRFDPDRDGLSTPRERELGTNPRAADTNADGLDDGAAVALGLSATSLDMDGDGVVNAVERGQGIDPFRADTDADGVGDRDDAFPLDPTLQQPRPNPSDRTPPVVTLVEPAGAEPLP